MLKFEQVEEDDIENTGDKESSAPKCFVLIYTDDELTEKSVPEIWAKLSEHDFEGDAENIDFVIYFDTLKKVSRIMMALYYSEDDQNILEVNEIVNHYRPLFEDFYMQNKPY